jgi:tetratricopeptide (TPR) repeat protein
MKRIGIAVAGVVLAVLIVYAYTWTSAYSRSLRYYRAAQTALAKGDFALALKGGQIFDPQSNAYNYQGGLQIVIETWQNPWAVPKPALYKTAEAELNRIIDQKMDPASAMAVVKQYARLDRRYLDEILLHVASVYKKEGKTQDARAAYEYLKELFPQNKELMSQVNAQIKDLGGS